MEKEIVNLGCMNGWSETPKVYKDALDKGFQEQEVYNDGHDYHKCQIETDTQILQYSYDSSD